jgi:hypothetical protein
MSLMGPFYIAVSDDEDVYSIDGLATPAEVALGVIPAEYIFEELKCVVTTPAPSGTTFKVIDQNDAVTIPVGRITVDRVVSSTANINKRITAQTTLTAVFDGPASSSGCEIVLIKKIWRIP